MAETKTLSARERQIMDAIYQLGGGTVREVHGKLSDPPSPTSVRTTLRILEERDTCFTNRTDRAMCTSPPSPLTKPVARC